MEGNRARGFRRVHLKRAAKKRGRKRELE